MGNLLVFRPVAPRPRRATPRRRAASPPRPCDFCMAPSSVWRYSCQDFAACDVCHPLVQAGRPGLDARIDASAPVPCDFCTAQRPAGRYPCLDFAACDVCRRLIEAGDRKAFAKRTYETAPVPPDLKANPGSRKAVMAVIVALHDKFFERAAPARPVRTPQPILIRPPHTPSPRHGVGSTACGRPRRHFSRSQTPVAHPARPTVSFGAPYRGCPLRLDLAGDMVRR